LLDVLAGQLAKRPAMHLDELVTRMDRRRRLAVVGAHCPTSSPGEACLTWAYHSLAAPEKRLFRLLALHPGTEITVDAACACDGRTPAETLESLMNLMAARLVRPTADLDRVSRHDVLGEFAARCLDRDDRDDDKRRARDRLLDFFVGGTTRAAYLLCHGDRPPSGDDGMVFADAEEAAAWFTRGQATLAAAVRRAHDSGCHDRTLLLADPLATLFEWAGRAAESTEIRALALESARATGGDEAAALHHLGVAHQLAGNDRVAQRCLTAALDLPLDDGLRVSALDRLGRLAALRGDTVEAMTRYRGAARVAERIADLDALAWLHFRMGQVLHAGDRLDDALVHLRRARTLAYHAFSRDAEVACLAEMGAIHRETGDDHAAFTHCEDALAVAEAIPDLAATARICVTLAEISGQCRRFDDAVAYARRGVATLQGTQDLAAQAEVVEALGDALHHSGEAHEAVVTWREAAELYDLAGLAMPAARLHGKMDRRRFGTAPPARAESPAPRTLGTSFPTPRNTFDRHAEG
jgi:tetratricopeptide (TPR) repeat protein